MKIAYIQPIGGTSGDMLLGAVVDLGVPVEYLQAELAKVNLDGFQLEASQETRCEIRGTYLKVELLDKARYSPKQFLRSIDYSALSDYVKDQSCKILKTLWKAESRVHGETEEELKLEELGSVDTIVDVVGSCLGLEYLGVEGVYAAPLVIGNSNPPRWAGGYSNPAPATLELIATAGAPVICDNPMYENVGELTTPTGAALITTLAAFGRPPFNVEQVGIGLGTKDPVEFSNALRIWIGEMAIPEVTSIVPQDQVVLLETNLDDVTGLVLGYTQERLFAMGALDVWNTPIQMKKNRPGTLLSVLIPKSKEREASEVILRETTTLGIRTRLVDRHVADRKTVNIETKLGSLNVKLKLLEGKAINAAPEPNDVRRIALESGIPFQEVYQKASEEARHQLL